MQFYFRRHTWMQNPTFIIWSARLLFLRLVVSKWTVCIEAQRMLLMTSTTRSIQYRHWVSVWIFGLALVLRGKVVNNIIIHVYGRTSPFRVFTVLKHQWLLTVWILRGAGDVIALGLIVDFNLVVSLGFVAHWNLYFATTLWYYGAELTFSVCHFIWILVVELHFLLEVSLITFFILFFRVQYWILVTLVYNWIFFLECLFSLAIVSEIKLVIICFN